MPMSSSRLFSSAQSQVLDSTASGEGMKVGSMPPQAASAAHISNGVTSPVTANTQ